MANEERIDRRSRESAVNSAVGGLLSWVAGKDSVKRGTSLADGRVSRKVFSAGHEGVPRPRMAISRAVSCLILRMVAAILV